MLNKVLAATLVAVVFWLTALGAKAQEPVTVYVCSDNASGTNNPGTNCSPASVSNPLPVSASVSASISGFAPVTTGTPISVTTGGVTGTLPAGTVVAAFNTGTTNTAYCKLGASSTTSDIAIPPASWFAFTVGAATQLTCITSTSTTTVNMVGGSGLPTGAGGGGGGSGGGGAVTIASGAVASGAYSSGSFASGAFASGSVGSGAMVDLGAIADAAATAGSTGTLSAKMRLMTTQLGTINTTLGTPFQAGGSIGNTTFAATQATAASLNATVVGTGTFATQSSITQGGNTAVVKPASGAPSSLDPAVVVTMSPNAWDVGSGTGGTKTQRVISDTTQIAVAATAAAVPANALYNGFNSGGNLVGVSSANPLPVTAATLDPCQSVAKLYVPISQATSTQLFAGTSAKKTYICSVVLVGADAENVSIVGGTGSVCATSPTAVLGGATAANGLNLAANGGFTLGNGMAFIAQGSVNADNICLLQSGSGRVSGGLTYVQN